MCSIEVLNREHIFTYEPIKGEFTYKATLDRTTTNKRDVMRAICKYADSYTTEENLEVDFDYVKEDYKYVGSFFHTDSSCICGHDIVEVCIVKYLPTDKEHESFCAYWAITLEEYAADGTMQPLLESKDNGIFIVGNDCIRLFSLETINLSQWIKSLVRGKVKQIPKWYQAKHSYSPFECIQSIHNYTSEFTIKGKYKRFGLVFNKRLKLYFIVGISKGNRVYSITKNERITNLNISEVKEIDVHLNALPIVSASMEALNHLFSGLGLPRIDSLQLDFGKYRGKYLNHLIVTHRDYCKWLLNSRSLDYGQEQYLHYMLDIKNNKEVA